jgi:replicative DNA helicase
VRRGDRRQDHRTPGHAAERELVRAVLADPHRSAAIAERVDPERFQDAHYRAIFTAMLALGDEFKVEQLAERLDEADVGALNELLGEMNTQIDPDKTIAASIAALTVRDIDVRLAEIDTIITLATEPEKIELANEKVRLQREIEQLGQPANKSFKFLRRRRSAPLE